MVYSQGSELSGPRYFTAAVSGDEKDTDDDLLESEETSPGCTNWRVCAPFRSGPIMMRICSP